MFRGPYNLCCNAQLFCCSLHHRQYLNKCVCLCSNKTGDELDLAGGLKIADTHFLFHAAFCSLQDSTSWGCSYFSVNSTPVCLLGSLLLFLLSCQNFTFSQHLNGCHVLGVGDGAVARTKFLTSWNWHSGGEKDRVCQVVKGKKNRARGWRVTELPFYMEQRRQDSEKPTLEQRPTGNCMAIWSKSVQAKNSKCKGPEVGTSLACLRNNQESRVAGVQWVKRRVGGERHTDEAQFTRDLVGL